MSTIFSLKKPRLLKIKNVLEIKHWQPWLQNKTQRRKTLECYTIDPKERIHQDAVIHCLPRIHKSMKNWRTTYSLELRRGLVAIFRDEVFVETDVGLAADLITWLAVRNTLDDATLLRKDNFCSQHQFAQSRPHTFRMFTRRWLLRETGRSSSKLVKVIGFSEDFWVM